LAVTRTRPQLRLRARTAGEDFGYVGECSGVHAVTQGATLDETVANLQEAVALALEGDDLEELGVAAEPVILVSFGAEPLLASASALTAA